MTHFIENDFLIVGVKEFGAEITSIISKESGFEFLWQGDASIWSGQSPILFPFIGRLLDDKYTLGGKEYSMQKHGFARKLPWNLHEKSSDSCISFILSESPDTLEGFPYNFDLIVTYSLDGKKLTVNHEVVNKNKNKMLFSLGAHPAFNCKIGDKLIFDTDEYLDTIKIDLDLSLRIPETYPLLRNERVITVTEDIFKEDALILKDVKSKTITLENVNSSRRIVFDIGGAPYLGIWAKPGAPYVCIEPWFGVNDSREKKADLSEKDGIQVVNAGEKFSFAWSAEFIE